MNNFYRAVLLGLCAFILPNAGQAAGNQPMECRLLPHHVADPGVAYQSGVDARGKAVAPADLNTAPFDANQTVVIPLSVDLASRMQGSVQGLQLEGNMGYLEIAPNGRVTYNGQDWTPQVYALCGQEIRPPVEGVVPVQTPDGQPAPDVIK